MKRINKLYIYIISIAMSFGMVSCLNSIDDTPIDPSKVMTFNQEEVFAKVYAGWALSGQQVTGAADITLNSGEDEGRTVLYRCLWNMYELPTDEAICQWGDGEVVKLQSNSFTTDNALIKYCYSRLYINIATANLFLQNTGSLTDDATLKQRAEVRFIRALDYYYLMDLYGNVPFVTAVVVDPPKQILRADLFAWIKTELQAIENDMYAPKQAPYYRLDRAANWLLQSRMYLNHKVYLGTESNAYYTDAASYAYKVITSNYDLAKKYTNLFSGDNAGALDGSTNDAPKEIIFPIAADSIKTQNWGTSAFLILGSNNADMPNSGINASGWAGNRARKSLVEKFISASSWAEVDTLKTIANDNRALFFTKDRTLDIKVITTFKQGASVIKFTNARADKKYTFPSMPNMDIPFMRKAEAYLTYAEAVTRGGTAQAYTALEAVNKLRTRANATQLNAINLNILCDEWAREFYFEGRRRLDLIRFGKFGGQSDYLWDWQGGIASGTSFDSHLNLMPIPSDDMSSNPNLVQNKGY